MRTWFNAGTQAICEVIVRPANGFGQLIQNPSIGVLLMLVVLVHACVTVALYPFIGPAALSQAGAQDAALGANVHGQSAVLRYMMIGQVIGFALAPLANVLKWAGQATLFWAVLEILGVDVPFRRLMATVAHANIPLLGAALVTGVVGAIRGYTGIQSVVDLHARLGLDAFWPGAPALTRALLALASPFEVWYMILLVIGVASAAGVRRNIAVVLGLGIWMLGATVQIATVVYSEQMARVQ